jgi:hypothetical protein
MIDSIAPAAVLPVLHSTSGADGGQTKDARTTLGDVRPSSVSGQDKATKDQAVAEASANVGRTLELGQATMAFESGDVAVAAQLLAPLARQGSAVASYDLLLISEFGFGSVGRSRAMPAHYTKASALHIDKLGAGLVV